MIEYNINYCRDCDTSDPIDHTITGNNPTTLALWYRCSVTGYVNTFYVSKENWNKHILPQLG